MALTDNLVAYYKCDEASGNALDAVGSTTLTDTNGVGTAPGIINTARDFEASLSQYFFVLDPPALVTGNIDFTWQAWVQLESKPGSLLNVLGKENTSSVNTEYSLRWTNTNDRFEFYVGGASYTIATANNLGAPSIGTWYHILGWHDSVADTVSIRVNGGTANTVSTGGNAPSVTTNQFILGGTQQSSAPTRFWDGLIDEVGFWKRVLTTQEQNQLYNSGLGLAYPFSGGLARIIGGGYFPNG